MIATLSSGFFSFRRQAINPLESPPPARIWSIIFSLLRFRENFLSAMGPVVAVNWVAGEEGRAQGFLREPSRFGFHSFRQQEFRQVNRVRRKLGIALVSHPEKLLSFLF